MVVKTTTTSRHQTPRASRSRDVGDTIIDCTVTRTGGEKDLEIIIPDGPDDEIKVTTNVVLGEGAFGTVLGGFMIADGVETPVAVKCSRKKVRGKEFDRLRDEVYIMKMMNHPNIVKFIHAGRCNDYVYIVMERCMKKSLQDVLKAGPLTLDDTLYMAYQIIDAIACIHSNGCIHRDLKPGNFVFDNLGNVKITDFGLSSKISTADSPRKTIAGTYTYMAPEMVAQAMNYRQGKQAASFSYSTEVDVWSIGVVLYTIATRTSPYWNQTKQQQKASSSAANKEEAYHQAISEARWEWPYGFKFDPEYMRLVESMLQKDGTKRPDVQQILRHPIWKRRPRACTSSLLRSLDIVDVRAESENYIRVMESEKAAIEEEYFHGLRILAHYHNEMKVRRNIKQEELTAWKALQRSQKLAFAKLPAAMPAPPPTATTATTSRSGAKTPSVKSSGSAAASVRSSTKRPSESPEPSAELSARYSFRNSTLQWDAAEVLGTPTASSRRSSVASTRAAKRSSSPDERHTPSFWLEGPMNKWGGGRASYDETKLAVLCPRKHPMEMLKQFPDRKTTGVADYGWGFWCDSCHKEVPALTKKNDCFFHCKCGYDLCKACGEKMGALLNKSRTTTINNSDTNRATVEHSAMGKKSASSSASSSKKVMAVDNDDLNEGRDEEQDAEEDEVVNPITKKRTTPPKTNTTKPPTAKSGGGGILVESTPDRAMSLTPIAPTRSSGRKSIVSVMSPPAPAPKVVAPKPAAKKATKRGRDAGGVDTTPDNNDTPPGRRTYGSASPTYTDVETGLFEGHDLNAEQPRASVLMPKDLSPISSRMSSTVMPRLSSPTFVAPRGSTILPKLSDPIAPHEAIGGGGSLFPASTARGTMSPIRESAFAPPPRAQLSYGTTRETATSTINNTEQPSPMEDAFVHSSPVVRSKRNNVENTPSLARQPSMGGASSNNNVLFPVAHNVVAHPPNVVTRIPPEICQLEGWVQEYRILEVGGSLCFGYMAQKNCFGALILNEYERHTAVLYDRSRRLIYHIPIENTENRRHTPHPYVDTAYPDTIHMINEADLRKQENNFLAKYVDALYNFAASIGGVSDEQPTLRRVVYVRKFFFDYKTSGAQPQWYLMRLSNGRTSISHPNEHTQVRWISQSIDTTDSKVAKYRVMAGQTPELFLDEEYFEMIRKGLEGFLDGDEE